MALENDFFGLFRHAVFFVHLQELFQLLLDIFETALRSCEPFAGILFLNRPAGFLEVV